MSDQDTNTACVTETTTLSETEVLRRQHSLMLKLWAATSITALVTILCIVLSMCYFHNKTTNTAVNAVARSAKYVQ